MRIYQATQFVSIQFKWYFMHLNTSKVPSKTTWLKFYNIYSISNHSLISFQQYFQRLKYGIYITHIDNFKVIKFKRPSTCVESKTKKWN